MLTSCLSFISVSLVWFHHFSLKHSTPLSDAITSFTRSAVDGPLTPSLFSCDSRSDVRLLAHTCRGFSQASARRGRSEPVGKRLVGHSRRYELLSRLRVLPASLPQIRRESPLLHVLSALGVIWLLKLCLSGKCRMVAHCGFNLFFCNY